ncbi:MAG: sulfotransferase family protein [Jatrophihabitantaceae bacterium]
MSDPRSGRVSRPGRMDWCCIGAQKAGTSTLYRLLREHPQIVIPASKEDPIFDADVTPEQVRHYLDARFAGAAAAAKCGTVTPQYLSAPDTAARMHRFVPRARIVVLLRDPVRRAFSHYQMSTLRGLETRSFDAAVADQLDTLERGQLHDLFSETDSYVVRGNYAWLLSDWFTRFGTGNILTVFSEELDTATAVTVERVHRFLGVDPRRPLSPDFRFNANPPRHRLSGSRRPVARALRRAGWDRINAERRERISSRIERTAARVLPAPSREIAPATARRLRSYYELDRQPLAELIGVQPPWAVAR